MHACGCALERGEVVVTQTKEKENARTSLDATNARNIRQKWQEPGMRSAVLRGQSSPKNVELYAIKHQLLLLSRQGSGFGQTRKKKTAVGTPSQKGFQA